MTADRDNNSAADDDEFEDEIDEPEIEHRTPLQAAIAWIMTRNAELTSALSDTELDPIDVIVRRAKITPEMSLERAWKELQTAVSEQKVVMWGHEFELPSDYEHGDVWPRGAIRQLTSKDLLNTCLIDVRGMALRPFGIIVPGQIWYCRAVVQTKELEAVFPPGGSMQLPRTKLSKDHKRKAAEDIYLRFRQTVEGWDRLQVNVQRAKIDSEMLAIGETKISERTLVEIRKVHRVK